MAKKRDERDEPTCKGYVEGGEREAAKYLVNRPWEDEEPEPPTCEGQVPDELVRKYLTLEHLLPGDGELKRPPPRKRRRRRPSR